MLRRYVSKTTCYKTKKNSQFSYSQKVDLSKRYDQISKKRFYCHRINEVMANRIFFSFVQQKWESENKRSGYTGVSKLILDYCTAHAAALNQFDLSAYHLKVIFLVPHSSHLTQPLELVTFFIQKLITIWHKISEKLTNQADQITSIIKGIQQASTSENIISYQIFNSAKYATYIAYLYFVQRSV